jgi:hypothetical protein
MPLSHCKQLNNFTNNAYQTATVEKRFPDFWQILPEWPLYCCLGYSDTVKCAQKHDDNMVIIHC